MPFIAEETVDRIEADVDDMKEALQAQTQAILALNERINLASEVLMKVHAAVTKPADGDGLGELLKALVEADKHHAAVLRQVLAEVKRT